MSLATVFSRALHGIGAPQVRVEVHLSGGLPCFNLVGLAETSVKESRERVRSAILNSRFQFPSQRLTINLAPADLPKQGGRYDLAIAIGILIASGQVKTSHLAKLELIGELSLSGDLRAIPGILPACLASTEDQHISVIPLANLAETQVIEGPSPLAYRHLLEVTDALRQEQLPPANRPQEPINCADSSLFSRPPKRDQPLASHTAELAEVSGQLQAKRALEITAAGRHNILMCGPPGAGKTLLASCLASLLPPPTQQQQLEIAIVRSISQSSASPASHGTTARPFRRPHHTCSGVALVGGGSTPRPGEITLAHQGVLFLDELPEFKRGVLEVLREPIETAQITISRAQHSLTFPADFQLIAAMNPCPCGYAGDSHRHCQCSVEQIKRYRGQLSGPLLDRIDLHLQVPRQSLKLLQNSHPATTRETRETSEMVRQRVIAAQQHQFNRQGCHNSRLSLSQIQQFCPLQDQDQGWWTETCEQLQLTSRGFHRSLLVARTIADLEKSTHIERPHLLEALSFRQTI